MVQELLKQGETEVIAILGRFQDRANSLPDNPQLKVFLLDELYSEPFESIDTVGIALSSEATIRDCGWLALDFTEKSIRRFENLGVKSVINISTQGVYRRLQRW